MSRVWIESLIVVDVDAVWVCLVESCSPAVLTVGLVVTKTNSTWTCYWSREDLVREAVLPRWSQILVEFLHQLRWREHRAVEERLKTGLVLAEGVPGQPELAVDEVERENSLFDLLTIVGRLGDQVDEVVVAHDDALSPDRVADDEVVLGQGKITY